MLYRVLADVVVVLHLAFILYVAFGGFLAWRWPKARWKIRPPSKILKAAGPSPIRC